ncbi:uncharacterized protein LOC107872812 isoform X3 [Capsicum annuum]|uniref:uncharacterized protein LOC107872812 isoform X3 n=1 Tax=Capsicum annuum TaxID=4072 RepID=UPI0007BEF5AC|nr:uncharacterized protein LOC107872812 isoform X3 [Capsicum annuum]
MHVLKVKLSLGCRFEAFEAVVVQLKAIASSLSAGEALSNTVAEKTAILQKLLRVMKRLNLKEHDTNISLHYLTLRALQLSLVDIPRGQNHF